MNNQYMIDNLMRRKEEIESLLKNYQQPQPVNNFITTTQTPSKDLVEWRILNENEEVDNLYVANKTLFINDETMILKDVDGMTQKWEVKKVYPIDKKDEKINALEEEIRKLKEMMSNEHAKSTSTTRKVNKSNVNVDGNVESESETTSESNAVNE